MLTAARAGLLRGLRCVRTLSTLDTVAAAVAATSSEPVPPSVPAFFPGDPSRILAYTPALASATVAVDAGDQPSLPCLRLMDEDGRVHQEAASAVGALDLSRADVERMYMTMSRLGVMDSIFFEAQRQGRISFYMTSGGEEGIHAGVAAALRDDDEVYAQYRESGVLLWRGWTPDDFAAQLFATEDDRGRGRQMPMHYGSSAHHFQTISSPLGTQAPQAAGAAYACKLEGRGRVVACFFGEGAASEGDVSTAFNIAATTEAPVLFICRNNGYAISTPVREQYRGDGIAARGPAFGIHTLRADGGDVFAVLAATRAARAVASGAGPSGRVQPVLLETMAYREGHHSTSDDSSRYRPADEVRAWREGANPVRRLRRFMERAGWWDEARETALIASERAIVLTAMRAAEKAPRPSLATLVSDVYAVTPPHLEQQFAEAKAHAAKYKGTYDLSAH